PDRITPTARDDAFAVWTDREGAGAIVRPLNAGQLAMAEMVEVAPLPAPCPLGALLEQFLDATDVARRPLALGQDDLVEIQIGLRSLPLLRPGPSGPPRVRLPPLHLPLIAQPATQPPQPQGPPGADRQQTR